ncbi:hypothetical protein [Shimia sagamensis]|uniref:Uncharacterized protein n=1 Tax=Shimia sagamensis TaxID=1566352 RepID=A0ABY1NHW9_9RHOB|nr:hypothetical protein [Shimia sagamensis]SMP09849.1 hypothetical protein SAMN06265373_10214 [Shimia sagamensis]
MGSELPQFLGFRRVLWASVCLLFVATPAVPCAFHGYQPKPTMVERLLEADSIVLVRPSAADPFHFEVTQHLKGNQNVVGPPFLVDSTTRRLMQLAPRNQVLFARNAETGDWHRLVTVDSEFDPILRDILESLSEWRDSPSSRAEFFANFLGHTTPGVRELALRELDLASYATLQALNLQVNSPRLRAKLDVLTQMDLRAIRILLLGFSAQDPELSKFLRHRLSQSVKNDGDMLGAYALSLVELDGQAGVKWLAEVHLRNQAYAYNTRSALVQAFAMHFQTGDVATRELISQTLSALVLFDVDLAYIVTLQFGALAPVGANDEIDEAGEDDTLAALRLLAVGAQTD